MNSRIRGIEDCDLLLMIGTNPRLESPVLNARIRKAYLNNQIKIGLVGTPANLTYDYYHLGNTTNTIKELFAGNHKFCSKISKV